MRCVFVAPEIVPFAKSGGLADVAGSLPRQLIERGCCVSLIMPYYRQVRQACGSLPVAFARLPVQLDGVVHETAVRRAVLDDRLVAWFIDYPPFFDRPELYGTADGDYADNAARFILLSRAATELCCAAELQPDIIHCHDWQAALVPALVRNSYGRCRALQRTRLVFTIHNMAYQGIFDRNCFDLTGLPAHCFAIDGLEFWGRMNLMKAGLVYADAITTVSPTYSRDIQQPEFGHGLQGVVRERRDVLHGILNGVDYAVWDPAHDSLLPATYDADALEGKAVCKRALISRFGLDAELATRPLLGCVSRLTEQKGMELMIEAVPQLVAEGAGFVLVGTGDRSYQDGFAALAQRFPGRVGVHFAYEEQAAHLLEAGADLFLMPSRFEPCGLNQLYSLRYGTLPVVRDTGGLADTVVDCRLHPDRGTGFLFTTFAAETLCATVRDALLLFADPPQWRQVMRRAMAEDFSWQRSADAYMRLYRQLTGGDQDP